MTSIYTELNNFCDRVNSLKTSTLSDDERSWKIQSLSQDVINIEGLPLFKSSSMIKRSLSLSELKNISYSNQELELSNFNRDISSLSSSLNILSADEIREKTNKLFLKQKKIENYISLTSLKNEKEKALSDYQKIVVEAQTLQIEKFQKDVSSIKLPITDFYAEERIQKLSLEAEKINKFVTLDSLEDKKQTVLSSFQCLQIEKFESDISFLKRLNDFPPLQEWMFGQITEAVKKIEDLVPCSSSLKEKQLFVLSGFEKFREPFRFNLQLRELKSKKLLSFELNEDNEFNEDDILRLFVSVLKQNVSVLEFPVRTDQLSIDKNFFGLICEYLEISSEDFSKIFNLSCLLVDNPALRTDQRIVKIIEFLYKKGNERKITNLIHLLKEPSLNPGSKSVNKMNEEEKKPPMIDCKEKIVLENNLGDDTRETFLEDKKKIDEIDSKKELFTTKKSSEFFSVFIDKKPTEENDSKTEEKTLSKFNSSSIEKNKKDEEKKTSEENKDLKNVSKDHLEKEKTQSVNDEKMKKNVSPTIVSSSKASDFGMLMNNAEINVRKILEVFKAIQPGQKLYFDEKDIGTISAGSSSGIARTFSKTFSGWSTNFSELEQRFGLILNFFYYNSSKKSDYEKLISQAKYGIEILRGTYQTSNESDHVNKINEFLKNLKDLFPKVIF